MFQTVLKRARQDKLFVLSGSLLLLVAILALFAPWLAPHDPNLVDVGIKLQGPSWEYPLGTDHLGRCLLSRLMHGGQISLGAAVLVMTVTMIVSTLVGTVAGYKGGWIDAVFMRLCDVLLAFPSLVLALVLIGLFGQSLLNLLLALMFVQWVWYARMIRGMVLSVKQMNYVAAAKVSGTPDRRIVSRHIWPTVLPQVVVLASLDIGAVILSISGLSFLGLGIQPPTAEWGAMINDSKPFLRSHPTLMLYPGLMILLVVTACNLLGDALRDALDPRKE